MLIMRSKSNGQKVKELLDSGTDIEVRGDNSTTPLMLAARNGHADVVKLLLDNGANIEVQNDRGRTAINYAFNIKDEEERKEVLEVFNQYCPEAFMSGYMDWSVGR
jgi:ankyrin repeat protein